MYDEIMKPEPSEVIMSLRRTATHCFEQYDMNIVREEDENRG